MRILHLKNVLCDTDADLEGLPEIFRKLIRSVSKKELYTFAHLITRNTYLRGLPERDQSVSESQFAR